MTALVFLKLNGFDIHGTAQEVEDMVLSIASGTLAKQEIADWLEGHC